MGKKKILSELETRNNILKAAKQLGCEKDVIQIFNKYDLLLRNCTNLQEREAISTMGNLEIHRLLSSTPGELSINGKIII